jgi:hypothetical protein
MDRNIKLNESIITINGSGAESEVSAEVFVFDHPIEAPDFKGSDDWSRATASDSGTLAHGHSVRTNSFAGDRPVGMGNSGADGDWYMIGDAGIANQGALYANSDNGSLAHAHTYYLPSHRHWLKSRPTSTSSHGHGLSGFIGSGSVDPVAGTIENRPKYMNCLMIIRVK